MKKKKEDKEQMMMKKMEKIDSILKAYDEDISTSSGTDKWATRGEALPRLTNLHNGREIVIVKRQITDTGTVLYHAHRYEEDKVFSVFDKCLCRFDLEHWDLVE